MGAVINVLFASIFGYIASFVIGTDEMPFMVYVLLGFGGSLVAGILLALIGLDLNWFLSMLASIGCTIALLKVLY